MKILITNDDGIDSPALVPFVRAMQSLGEVRVVVPAGEKSWIGKAITRHGVLEVRQQERGGIDMTTVTGTPADCVSMALHSLEGGRPDLVVSGINLGLNYSLAFLISSGTVGAALESWIGGVPSIAFSMGLPSDAWGVADSMRAGAVEECARTTSAVSRDIVDALLVAGYPTGIDTITVNMPADARLETPRFVAPVTRSRYGRLFVEDSPGKFVHRFENLWAVDEAAGGDMAVVDRGHVAITPVRLQLDGEVTAAWKNAMQQTSSDSRALS